jgi:hypothetical protein
MATAMLVSGAADGEPVLGPAVAERLAGLGVTRISLLRDARGMGLVVDGWAFDEMDVDEVVRIVFPAHAAVRVLREVERVALTLRASEHQEV